MPRFTKPVRHALRRRGALLGTAVLAMTWAACDTESLISLPDPDLITLPIIQDTANLPILRNGVVFEFARAVSGPDGNNETPGVVGLSGLLADEMWYSSTFISFREMDARTTDDSNVSLLDVYQYVHRARALAENAIDLFASSPRANSTDHALMANLAGYTYVFFAESFCSGVPISFAPFIGAVQYGPGRTTDELFGFAIDRFDEAMTIAQAAGSVEQTNLARVGMARAQLGLGLFTEAATTAAPVPDDFEFLVTYGQLPAPQNGVWYNINAERRSSAATNEGVNGIEFFSRGEAGVQIDPRVPADSGGMGIGTMTPLYFELKYPDGASDIPLANGTEARLIEAEAALDGGQSAGYLPMLNALRSTVAGLNNLADPGNADGRVRQLMEERAFWLWLTGHRLSDLRRMIRYYGFTEDEVFPVGQTIFGEVYGDDVNLPIPFDEENNPQYSGQCIDRNA